MTRRFAACCGALLALNLQPFPAGLGSAQAAQLGMDLGRENITVDGPYTISQEMTRRALRGRPPETTLSISQQVRYGDLDLSKPSDVDELRDRLSAAARDNCRQLDLRFPREIHIPDQSRFQCLRNGRNNAVAQLEAITGRAVASADRVPVAAR